MRKKILIADDTNLMREMLKAALDPEKYQIVGEALTGEQAVEYYKEKQPDLLILDINMPKMNGIDALAEIMKFDPNANVIMCSAMGQQAMVIEAIQAGAKDFIVKPFQADRVIEAVKKVVG